MQRSEMWVMDKDRVLELHFLKIKEMPGLKGA